MIKKALFVVVFLMALIIPVVATDGDIEVTFTGNYTQQSFLLIDGATAACPDSSSTILYENGTLYGCYNNTVLVEDSSYKVNANAITIDGDSILKTLPTWFTKTVIPINGLTAGLCMLFAFGVIFMTGLMATSSTAPQVSIVVCFEGWIFYGLNFFAPINTSVPAIGEYSVPAVLTLMTFVAILWNFAEFRRKNK